MTIEGWKYVNPEPPKIPGNLAWDAWARRAAAAGFAVAALALAGCSLGAVLVDKATDVATCLLAHPGYTVERCVAIVIVNGGSVTDEERAAFYELASVELYSGDVNALGGPSGEQFACTADDIRVEAALIGLTPYTWQGPESVGWYEGLLEAPYDGCPGRYGQLRSYVGGVEGNRRHLAGGWDMSDIREQRAPVVAEMPKLGEKVAWPDETRATCVDDYRFPGADLTCSASKKVRQAMTRGYDRVRDGRLGVSGDSFNAVLRLWDGQRRDERARVDEYLRAELSVLPGAFSAITEAHLWELTAYLALAGELGGPVEHRAAGAALLRDLEGAAK
jgi:hypothetical protein